VILDEPANGLDPEGILWIRNLLKGLAREGRTVFLSSHLMSEIALTADHVVVVGRGRLVVDASVDDVVATASTNAAVLVRSERSGDLARALAGPSVTIEHHGRAAIEIHGLTSRQIGEVAARERIVLDELTPRQASLEEAFMALTGDSVEYRTVPSTEPANVEEAA
jgi:ABC-2 type transport system ATP-binding protein